MTNKHITSLEVSNFKKFDKLVVENIGQVNLITGDNNVGKTSLLEVLLLEPTPILSFQAFNYMILSRSMTANTQMKFKDGNEEHFRQNNVIGLNQGTLDRPIIFSSESQDTAIIKLVFTNEVKPFKDEKGVEKLFNSIDLDIQRSPTSDSDNNRMIITGGNLVVGDSFYNETMASYMDFPILKMEDFAITVHQVQKSVLESYPLIIRSGADESKLIEILNSIFPLQIVGIRYGKDALEIRTKNQDEYRPISNFGDGFIKVLKIVLLILRSNHSSVMIDEIDAGIHFSRMKHFWASVLLLAKETKTQIFCTTHSQDCINAFVDAAGEMGEMKDKIRLIELEEAKLETSDRNVFASTYDIDQIVAGLNSDVNLRGGTL